MQYKTKFIVVVVLAATLLSTLSFKIGQGGTSIFFISLLAALLIIRRFINRCKRCQSWNTIGIIFTLDPSGTWPANRVTYYDRVCRDCWFAVQIAFTKRPRGY